MNIQEIHPQDLTPCPVHPMDVGASFAEWPEAQDDNERHSRFIADEIRAEFTELGFGLMD